MSLGLRGDPIIAKVYHLHPAQIGTVRCIGCKAGSFSTQNVLRACFPVD